MSQKSPRTWYAALQRSNSKGSLLPEVLQLVWWWVVVGGGGWVVRGKG